MNGIHRGDAQPRCRDGHQGAGDSPARACEDELGRANVYGAGALVARLGLIRHLGAFAKRAKAVADDRALVDEQVLRAVIRGDEAEALLVAEPLHGSTRHVRTPLVYVRRTQRMREATTASACTVCRAKHPTVQGHGSTLSGASSAHRRTGKRGATAQSAVSSTVTATTWAGFRPTEPSATCCSNHARR